MNIEVFLEKKQAQQMLEGNKHVFSQKEMMKVEYGLICCGEL